MAVNLSDYGASGNLLAEINELGRIVRVDRGECDVIVKDGDLITVESRRGKLNVYARRDDGLQFGQIFIPFCYVEAAANVLTNAALDPDAKIPEFKFCAVKIKKAKTN